MPELYSESEIENFSNHKIWKFRSPPPNAHVTNQDQEPQTYEHEVNVWKANAQKALYIQIDIFKNILIF